MASPRLLPPPPAAASASAPPDAPSQPSPPLELAVSHSHGSLVSSGSSSASSSSPAQLASLLSSALREADQLRAQLNTETRRANKAERLLSAIQSASTGTSTTTATAGQDGQPSQDSPNSKGSQPSSSLPDSAVKSLMEYEARAERAERAREDAEAKLQALVANWGEVDRYLATLEVRAADARNSLSRAFAATQTAPLSSATSESPPPPPSSRSNDSHQLQQQSAFALPPVPPQPPHLAFPASIPPINPANSTAGGPTSLSNPPPPPPPALSNGIHHHHHHSHHRRPTNGVLPPPSASSNSLSQYRLHAQASAPPFQTLPLPPPPSAAVGNSAQHSSMKRNHRRFTGADDEWDSSSRRTRVDPMDDRPDKRRMISHPNDLPDEDMQSRHRSYQQPPIGANANGAPMHPSNQIPPPPSSAHHHRHHQHHEFSNSPPHYSNGSAMPPGAHPYELVSNHPYSPASQHQHVYQQQHSHLSRHQTMPAAYDRVGSGMDLDREYEARGRRRDLPHPLHNSRPRSTSRTSAASSGTDIDEMLLAVSTDNGRDHPHGHGQHPHQILADRQQQREKDRGRDRDREYSALNVGAGAAQGGRSRSGTAVGVGSESLTVRPEVGPHKEPPSLQTYQTHVFAPPVTGAPIKKNKTVPANQLVTLGPGGVVVSGGGAATALPKFPGGGYPATNQQGQRICRQCGLPGRHKDGKCVEKWGPGPEGPGTVCDRCRKKMKRVERRGTMDANAAMGAVQGRLQSRATPQQSSTAPNSASPPATTTGPGMDHPRRPTSPSPLGRGDTLIVHDSDRERNGTMVSSATSGFGGSSLRVNGTNGDSMVMAHSRRGSPVRDRERERARLGDRSTSSTASTVVGGNLQNGNGYPSNGKMVGSLHPSVAHTNGRRIPTPPFINSISSREQHGSLNGDDDDEHDDADMSYDGGDRDLLEMIESSPQTSATRGNKLDARLKLSHPDSRHSQSQIPPMMQHSRSKHLMVNGSNGSMLNHQYRRLSTGDELDMDADGDGDADPDAEIMEAVDASGKDELVGELKEEDV